MKKFEDFKRPKMKLKLIEFKIRYIGDKNVTIKTEVVEIEGDSTEKEEVEQIKDHYHRNVVMPETNKIGQTYSDYTIINHDYKLNF